MKKRTLMNRGRKYCVLTFLVVFFAFVFFELLPSAFATDNTLVGKWGYVDIEHHDSGQWGTTLGTIIFNDNGTATDTFTYNWGGTLGSNTNNFTYAVTPNLDGSWNLSVTSNGQTGIYKIILSDDKKVFMLDGTQVPGRQVMYIFIKMDTEKTYTNADLNFDAFGIGYDHDLSKSLWPGYYTSWSGIKHFDGMGNCPLDVTFNSDGIVQTLLNLQDSYTLNADGSGVMMNGRLTGFLGKDERLAVFSYPGVAYDWSIALGMRRGDKTYSTADLAGTWALVAFGDDYGNSFSAKVGSLICDSNGICRSLLKNRWGLEIVYVPSVNVLSVASDGSFGSSLGEGSPSYAGAIGNNGNTILANLSFLSDSSQPSYRDIFVGVRCTNCYNLAGQMIPMLTIDPAHQSGGNGINIYLYDPVSQMMHTVKENIYDSWFPSTDISQTMLVYTEGITSDPYTIQVYDIASGTISVVTTAATERAAYFDGDGKIVFLDSSDLLLKKMDPEGTNITTIAVPEPPYNFDVFWMSPDREKIVIGEEREEGDDYHTGHYERLVLMNTDGTDRSVLKSEYLGDWNNLSWKPDSSGFLYFHHLFDVVNGIYQGTIYQHEIIDIDGSKINLSGSDLANKGQNACFFTKSGNLLSLSYSELYNGQTGTLIAYREDVPLWTDEMFGFDGAGDIYFAKLDKSNFRRFIENKSGDLSSDGVLDISDVILDLRCALGLDQCDNPCADINVDGVVDISDVILTLRMALGLDPLRPCTGQF